MRRRNDTKNKAETESLNVPSDSVMLKIVELISSGPSTGCQADCLGVFEFFLTYNGFPAYKQKHTIAGPMQHFLFRQDNGDWCVSKKLGSSSEIGLLNRTKSDSVPETNWLYFNGKDWLQDPKLTTFSPT